MSRGEIIGAFGESDAARLTGLTVGQLRAWDRSGLLRPSYADQNRVAPYSRVYSFRDIVSLRVLASLRLEHRVSVQHLRRVSERLAHLGEERWTATTLYVLGRRVVFDDPKTLTRQEVVSGQRVFDIPLRVAIRSTQAAIRDLNARPEQTIGHVVSERFVMNNRPVFEGTRIPLAAVTAYLERGTPVLEILQEFPELREGDVEEARSRMRVTAA
jgi:DNA-binding transcriptional MerR regulator